eukprot:3971111-Ditylum_brightwellii.AAC.1
METVHNKGERDILAGDFNEPIHSTSGMMKLCSNETIQLVDILGSVAETKFSTTKAGQERIDYILMSPDLVLSVRKRAINHLS